MTEGVHRDLNPSQRRSARCQPPFPALLNFGKASYLLAAKWLIVYKQCEGEQPTESFNTP